MSTTVVCYYGTFASWAASVLTLPTLIGLSITVLNVATGQFIFASFGWFLLVMGLELSAIASLYEVRTPDPFCPEHSISGVPSQVGFYVGAVAGAFVAYKALYRRHPGWIAGFCVLLLLGVPPVAVVASGYNRWEVVLISVLIGFFVSALFIALLRAFAAPHFPVLLREFPFGTIGYQDTFYASEEDAHIARTLKTWDEQRSNARRGSRSHSSFWLYL